MGHNTFRVVTREGNGEAEFIGVSGWQSDIYSTKKRIPFSFHAIFFKCVPGYLNATLHDECGELGHHKVHAFEAGLFEFEDLLFDNRLKRQVRGEKPRSEKSGGQIVFLWGGRGE